MNIKFDKKSSAILRGAAPLAGEVPLKPVNAAAVPLYKRDLLGNHRVRVYRPQLVKPGTVIQMRDGKYVRRADGSLKRVE